MSQIRFEQMRLFEDQRTATLKTQHLKLQVKQSPLKREAVIQEV